MTAGPWFDGPVLNDLPRMNQFSRPTALIRAALTLELGDVFYAMDEESEGGEMDRVLPIVGNAWRAVYLARFRQFRHDLMEAS